MSRSKRSYLVERNVISIDSCLMARTFHTHGQPWAISPGVVPGNIIYVIGLWSFFFSAKVFHPQCAPQYCFREYTLTEWPLQMDNIITCIIYTLRPIRMRPLRATANVYQQNTFFFFFFGKTSAIKMPRNNGNRLHNRFPKLFSAIITSKPCVATTMYYNIHPRVRVFLFFFYIFFLILLYFVCYRAARV